MRVTQELIHKPIISIKEGQELGKIQDFYLDQELGSITGVYLGKEGLLSRNETAIKWENVVTVGMDALLVNEATAALNADEVSEFDDYVRRDDLIGRPIDTPGGTKIGRIGDIVIDQDATIAGFSLSQIFVSGPIAANRAVSRSAMVDTGNEDGVLTAELAKAEEANLKVVYEGFFAEPSVASAEEDNAASA
jgi:sporulation protein YlmC with PRC-barrel domain